MADETLTSGEAYTFTLLEEWKALIEYGKTFRLNYLEGRCDSSSINAYVGALTNFYEVLAPKVHAAAPNGTEWSELSKEFDDWILWVENPTWFQEPGSMDKIFQLRALLGKVVEKLDVTYFPKAVGRNP
jgi:hypothetical protein